MTSHLRQGGCAGTSSRLGCWASWQSRTGALPRACPPSTPRSWQGSQGRDSTPRGGVGAGQICRGANPSLDTLGAKPWCSLRP